MADPRTDLRGRALALLARREHSRRELERKLRPHAEDPEALRDLLDDFQRRGWLSEARFTEQVVHARQKKYGAARIVHELKEKGVSGEAIAAALPELKAGELAAARAVWEKKFGHPPRDAAERAKQMRFLAGRGFGQETIRKVLAWDDD